MPQTAPSTSPVVELADRFWQWFLSRQPFYATILGDERYDDRLPDPSAAGRAEEVAALEGFLADTERIAPGGLTAEDAITLDMLSVVCRIQLRGYEQHLYQLEAVDQMAGPQSIPGELSRFQRVDSAERVDRLIKRLEAFPAYLAAQRENFEAGRAAGRTAAAPVVARVIEQTRRSVELPIGGEPLLAAHPEFDAATRARITKAVEDHVRPALADFLAALEAYEPAARAGDGLWALDDGDEIYRTLVLASTTLEADPQELHDYGLGQLEAIEQERRGIAAELGFGDVAAMRRALAADPAGRASRGEQIVELARAQIERAMAVAPRYFGRLPRAGCEVREVEPFQAKEAPPAFYFPPASDGSRGGVYYVNTYEPENRPLYRLAATTFHEAVPGHHFQIALEAELDDLPDFRRYGARLVGIAYPEGWGLYSERLADEMGLYATPWERLGMLDAQAWRAARLVVDTGIHAFRWERERSVRLLESIGLTTLEAEAETDRYIAWPAQALAYMTGQREIAALRRELEQRDGASFDLAGFHDAVLGHGTLPLATLRRELPGWVRPRGG
ncbi:MAG TPA: DUF885 domain-containing protein [Candidatus Limnocylindria bacterium]|jgi:uncharacterized protein (DUF885 family)|nr:DUF885 domain-containing protein [Candidatus Limnocylindria bacterium]